MTLPVLNAIYEEDFLGFSYGFHPGRGQHDALDVFQVGFYKKKINCVLDADLPKYFDLRLIKKWLTVIIMEDGKIRRTIKGTPQGAVISPLLANVYLPYVFDL